MQFASGNLLISLLLLQLVLILSLDNVSGFDFFKKKEKKDEVSEKNEEPVKGEETDDVAEQAKKGAWQESKEKADATLEAMNAIKRQQLDRNSKKPPLDKVRVAMDLHQLYEAASGPPILPKRATFMSGKSKDTEGNVQGRGRRQEKLQAHRRAQEAAEAEAAAKREAQKDEYEEQVGDEDDDKGDEFNANSVDKLGQKSGKLEATSLIARLTNKHDRDQASRKFVSTLNKNDALKPNLNFLRPNLKVVTARKPGEQEAKSSMIKKNKLITGAFWQKQLGKAYKKTKQGIKEGANFISEIPASVQRGVDSVNAFLQLDDKGKILALIDETSEDAHFVRKEFSQFTLSWSPIMEKALDYLGDQYLDKLKWNDKDELDHRRDALNSLTFGYEFMRLLIVWRENLLIAHEAFKLWLESVKTEVTTNHLVLDESLVMQLRTTHTYILLNAWMSIEKEGKEARTKLDFLMEIEDDRPKNYESEYFRNIVVLQEMYVPTIDEFEKERSQVVNSISESGVVVDNLQSVDEFFENFRSACLKHEVTGVDWQVPQELTDFMAKLEPQLRKSSLIYTKAFLKENDLDK